MNEDFETDADGDISTCPLVGWTAAPIYGTALLTKLMYYALPEALARQERSAVQLVWTPQQCREFAALLTTMAERLSRRPDTGAPN